ncbi:MAG: CPBP family intramembrane metalloprotease [Muribaculaceae bacterium]|nr:CPBP family intramembrane metalloprotease [Muribaculaceae bacterium]
MSTTDERPAPLTLTFGKRIVLFTSIFILLFLITSVLCWLIIYIGHENQPSLRIAAVVQDILIFIVPAITTALLVTRRPDRFLHINIAPGASRLITSILTLLVAIPAMNALIAWNESLHLPQALSGLEQWMIQSEQQANAFTAKLMSGTSFADLALGILIIGVLAGLSEELFFRGTLQRLLITRPMNPHVAIWLTAFIFSVFHFQFFGFFPRLLLGAYLGYLVYWTQSLWIPVIVHALNNSLVVLTTWLSARSCSWAALDHVGVEGGIVAWITVIASIILIACGITRLARSSAM